MVHSYSRMLRADCRNSTFTMSKYHELLCLVQIKRCVNKGALVVFGTTAYPLKG